MIVSKSKNLIFLHPRKTAGTSFINSFYPYLHEGDIILGDIEYAIKHKYNSMYTKLWIRGISLEDVLLLFKFYRNRNCASELARNSFVLALKARCLNRYNRFRSGIRSAHSGISEISSSRLEININDYSKIIVLRDPAERLKSFYFWRSHRNRFRYPNYISFITFISHLTEEKIPKGFENYSEENILVIGNKIIKPEFVLKFENLEDSLKKLGIILGIELIKYLPEEKKNVSKKYNLSSDEIFIIKNKILKKENEIFSLLSNYYI